jgi:hypothetical protein
MSEPASFFQFLYSLLVVAVVVYPLFRSIRKEIQDRASPDYFKRHGVIVTTVRALDEAAEIIGRYMGVDIYHYVTFMGHRYEYACVAPPSWKSRIGENLLYLEPGIVYVATE